MLNLAMASDACLKTEVKNLLGCKDLWALALSGTEERAHVGSG